MIAEILLAILVLLLVYAGITQLLRLGRPSLFMANLSLTHSLAMAGILGIVPFFVTMEMAGRYGLSVVLAMAAFSFIYLLSPAILAPVQFLVRTYRFPSMSDMLQHRFRGSGFAKLTCAVAVLASLPFAVAQVMAIAAIIDEYIFYKNMGLHSYSLAILLAVLPVGGVGLWLAWQEDRSASTRLAYLATIAGLTLFAFLTLAVTAIALIHEVFGGIDELLLWTRETRQDRLMQRYDSGYAFVTLFFIASMVLPQLNSVYARSQLDRVAQDRSWMFPLLLFLISLPVLPLVWSGLSVGRDIPLQLYATLLPGLLGMPLVSVLIISGAMAAAACGFALLAVALSENMLSTFCHPHRQNFTRINLYRWIRGRKRLSSVGFLLLTLVAALLVRSRSLTDLVLVSFIGLAQLAPAVLATFYFPKINRKGVATGLSVAMVGWFCGLFLPLFIGSWEIAIPGFGSIRLGVGQWHHILYELLFLNFSLCLVVSLFSETGSEEERFAEECMVDSVLLSHRVEIAETSIADIRERLGGLLGEVVAAEEIEKITEESQLELHETRPQSIRVVREKLAQNLTSLIGAYAGHRIVEEAIPLSGGHEIDDLVVFEDLLPSSSGHLTGLAAELNRLRLHHRTTLENLPIGVCSLDTEGEVLFWNRSIETFTGISAEKTTGALLRQLPEPWAELLNDFFRSDDTRRPNVRVPHANRDQWCNLYKAVLDIKPSQLLGSQVLLLEDITDALLLSRELAHSERLASVGRLAAGVAHEIGNPVTGIACLAQDLNRDAIDSESRESATKILEQTARIADIVHALTNYSRRSEKADDEFRALSMEEPVKSAIKLLNLQHDRKVAFTTDVADNVMVMGDANQLTQVFLNLLTNARDASPDQSVVTVKVQASSERVIARVTDEGGGIPESIRDQIFEPFFTTKETGEGTGLGLSLVYDIIRNHRGEIKVVERERGNCMEISLPRVLA